LLSVELLDLIAKNLTFVGSGLAMSLAAFQRLPLLNAAPSMT
jgi:hypothetical protein